MTTLSTPVDALLIGELAGLLGSALFGLSNIVYKSVSSEIRPLAINALKMWITLPVMIVIALLPWRATSFAVPPTAILPLILSIIIGAVIGDICYLTSQSRLGVSRAFPIAMSYPLFTYLFAFILLSEPVGPVRVLGVALTIAGVSLITGHQSTPKPEEPNHLGTIHAGRFDTIGIVLALIAAISWAISAIILQLGLVGVEPADGNLIRIVAGCATLLPLFAAAKARGMPMPTTRATKRTLLAGFFGMGIGSFLYVTAVKYAGAALSSVLAATAPLFALPASFLVLKERITPAIVAGTIAAVLGVWLVILGF
jgi:drug/metabolite transporter (DMT)-like permease